MCDLYLDYGNRKGYTCFSAINKEWNLINPKVFVYDIEVYYNIFQDLI